ncbi:hypothetical protein BDQ17DRAFT_1321990 [Cyathus striatus]|nr:hypothetical protein BDQ17DRAFT_1321990 [Cyathus striatus]
MCLNTYNMVERQKIKGGKVKGGAEGIQRSSKNSQKSAEMQRKHYGVVQWLPKNAKKIRWGQKSRGESGGSKGKGRSTAISAACTNVARAGVLSNNGGGAAHKPYTRAPLREWEPVGSLLRSTRMTACCGAAPPRPPAS